MAYRFGPFELDPRTGTLSGPEGLVPLRKQAFRLAEVLLERAPELLDHNTLLDEVWGRRALSANALTQTICELRHALGDDAHHPCYIETVHRRGYRIVCPVHREAPGDAPLRIRKARSTPSERTSGDALRVGATLLALALLVASAPPPAPGTDLAPGTDPAWQHPAGEQPPLALLTLCNRLPQFTDLERSPGVSPFLEMPGASPTGTGQANLPTCLPAP